MKLNLRNKINKFLIHRKKIFILLFAFFLTGCSIDYNVLVDEKKRVEESITMFVSNEDIKQYNNSVEGYLTSKIYEYKNKDIYKPYQFARKIGKENSYVILTRKFKSLKEYSESPNLKNLFEFVIVEEDDSGTSLKTTGKYYKENIYSDYVDTVALIENITIKYKFYNNIIESNADEFDEKNNILIWTIDINDNEKHLYFKIGNDKRYDIIMLDKLYKNVDKIIIVISTIGVVGIISLIYLYFYKISKKNNEI